MRTSLERIGAVAGGLLVFGTVAGLLDVTGWAALVLVLLGGGGFAVAVGRWRSSSLHAFAGAVVAFVCLIGIGFLKVSDKPGLGFDGSPLDVAVSASAHNCGTGWVFPVAPDKLTTVDEDDPWEWAKKLGGVPARALPITLTVDTEGKDKVTLHDLRVVGVKRSAPATGTHVAFACGGDTVYRWMGVDLDADPPQRTFKVQEAFAEEYPPAERKPIAFPYVVSSSDPESFLIATTTSRYSVEFYLEIDWALHGRTGTMRIDDNGSPFRVRAVSPGTPDCIYVSDEKPFGDSSDRCPEMR